MLTALLQREASINRSHQGKNGGELPVFINLFFRARTAVLNGIVENTRL